MTIHEKLTALREQMCMHHADSYYVQNADPHGTECVAPCWMAREWLSGFTGSAGTLVVTATGAHLWADGRYHIQAARQIAGTEIELFKQGNPGVPTPLEWMESHLEAGSVLGVPAALLPSATCAEFEERLEKKRVRVGRLPDLCDGIWPERPAIPQTPVFVHELQFAGRTVRQKLDAVREEMKKADAGRYLLSSLDDICWLFNIRGNDVAFMAVTLAHAIVGLEDATLFIEASKTSDEVRSMLAENGVDVRPYGEMTEAVAATPAETRVALDSKRISGSLRAALPASCKVRETAEIVTSLKAVKNDVEQENYAHCQISDGIAMVRFLIWLEENLGKEPITEYSLADTLRGFRSQQPNNIGPGFQTIAGFRDHGAMMHYSARPDTCYALEGNGLMVLDSGGQYLSGTTDMTRTLPFGDLSEQEIFDFTYALKAHIGLASARFLHGATGSNLDVLARKPLWDIGLNYNCGTGHGVGYCLNVHEGPHGFSQGANPVKLEKGMVVTIEPGIYREGLHGVRTENMVLVVPDGENEYGEFLRFEAMTLCPIALRAINPELMSEQELDWLDNYHRKVFATLSPHLEESERIWLERNTWPVEREVRA